MIQNFRFTNSEFRFTILRMSDIETAYNSALDYLYSFVDYSLKHSSELAKADFNLDRMRALMVELGHPEAKYPTIHVAGTKGKGSVSALCASALQAAGYKVGLYTSPHLLDYTERIQINDQPVSHQGLVDLVEQIKPAVAKISANLPRLRSQPHLAFYTLPYKKWTWRSSKLNSAGGLMQRMWSYPKFPSSLRFRMITWQFLEIRWH